MCAAAAVPAIIAGIQAVNQAAAQRTQAKIAENEAKIGDQRAAIDQTTRARQRDRQLGKIAAGAGASGLSLEGSPVDVLGDVARESKLADEDADWETTVARQRAKAAAGAAKAAAVSTLMGSNVLQSSYDWLKPSKKPVVATDWLKESQ